jgi:hypothetical protein
MWALAAVADRLMFSETIGALGFAQDVKTRQRTPIVPKIDRGIAMMIATTTIAAGRRNLILPSLDAITP